MIKVCIGCKIEKDFDLFSRSRKSKDGRVNLCKVCQKIRSDLWYLNNKERHLKNSGIWYEANKERKNTTSKIWQKENKEKCEVYQRKYREANSDKIKDKRERFYAENREKVLEWCRKSRLKHVEKRRAAGRLWQKRNPIKVRAIAKNRDKRVRRTTPPWAKRNEISRQMLRFYENTPKGYHVDHIVPLKGKNVSGLHVPWNLQYLTADENMTKHDKF